MRSVSLTQFPSHPLPVVGVGAMPFSHQGADSAAAAAVWHHSFDAGITLINTADCYAPSGDDFGHNERLVGAAVRSFPGGRDAITVVTKNGLRRSGDDWWRDNSPEYLLQAAEASVERLGFVPDVLCLHRLNREQSLAAAVEALCEARARGFTRKIGVSNVTLAEFEIAWTASGETLTVVENERSPRYREDADVLAACTERGIAYLAWSPLGGGSEAAQLGEKFPDFAEVGSHYEATAQQTALAWLIASSPSMIPIPAFTRTATADSTVAATEITLTAQDIARLDATSTGPGSVYPD